MMLQKLLQDIVPLSSFRDSTISHLTHDSRTVVPGSLFFACRGAHTDGRHYVAQAIEKGAAAVLWEKQEGVEAPVSTTVPVIPVDSLPHKMGLIASRFYENPSASFDVIGVTGTNGKTSCTHFLAAALSQASGPCAVMGTVGNGFLPHLTPGGYTTEQAIALQQTLAQFHEEGAQAVAMEVSSHGLDQHRVEGVQFDIGVFTNLTRDHLDYHETMVNYGAAKARLFQQPGLRYGVINYDDEFGRELLAKFNGVLPVYAYSANPEPLPGLARYPHIKVEEALFHEQGIDALVATPWGHGSINSRLVGQFNLSNLLAVLTCLGLLNIPFVDALKAVNQLKSVCGRMETFGGGKYPQIVVDYAHTPDALEKVLIELRHHCRGQLFVVFGCGGGRDKGKRPLMGQLADRYGDFIILTNDNPRHENPRRIIEEILAGMSSSTRQCIIEQDRRKAIAYALGQAKPEDIILIAGKGHETYQQIGDEKLPFSDQQQVIDLLKLMA